MHRIARQKGMFCDTVLIMISRKTEEIVLHVVNVVSGGNLTDEQADFFELRQ